MSYVVFKQHHFSALTLLVGWQEEHPACKKWGDGGDGKERVLSGEVLAWLPVCSDRRRFQVIASYVSKVANFNLKTSTIPSVANLVPSQVYHTERPPLFAIRLT